MERSEVTAEAAAARLGITVERLQERLELVALSRLAGPAPVQRPVRARWLVAAAMVVAGISFAQLTSFTADTPALASEVNGNFTQLRTWLEQKVGTVGTANVTITGASTFGAPAVFQAGASVDGGFRTNALTVTGATTTGSLSTGSFSGGAISGSSLSVSGDIAAGGNTWGSTSSTPSPANFNRITCSAETGSQCPQGQYVCGLYANHVCGQAWYELTWRLQCCSL